MRLKKLEAGFTLVELLVVIGIIVLLASLIFPQINKARQKAARVKCVNFLRQLGMAATEYIEDDESQIFPWAGDDATATDHLNLLVAEGYVDEPKMFKCPAAARGKGVAQMDDEENFTLTQRTNSYAWSSVPLCESDKAATILGCDGAVRGGEGDNNHAGGMNTLRIDGATEWVKMKKTEDKKLPEDLVGP